MRTFPGKDSSRASAAYVALGAVLLGSIGAIILVRESRAWTSAPLLVLGLWLVVRGALLRRARVEVGKDRITVHAGGIRAHTFTWSEVTELHVDPPGGPRLLRVTLSNGASLVLPELTDADREDFLALRPR